MLNGLEVTAAGNLTGTPELRFTNTGLAVCNFTVAINPRQFNSQTKEWAEADSIFIKCAVWRDLAENVAESFSKGDRVLIAGELKFTEYVDDDEITHAYLEMNVREIAASVKFAQVTIRKMSRKSAEEPEDEEAEKAVKRPTRGKSRTAASRTTARASK